MGPRSHEFGTEGVEAGISGVLRTMEGNEWTERTQHANDWSTRRDRDQRMRKLAWGHGQLISVAQLRSLGFSRRTIHRRIHSGRLHPTPFAGVLALSPPPLSRHQTIRAAVLSCGTGAVASHWSAAEVLRIVENPQLLPVHVTRPGGNARPRPNIHLHRAIIPPSDTVGRDGLLVIAAARTLVDLAPLAEPDDLEDMLIAADSLGILNHRRLDELLDPAARRRGARKLRTLLGEDPVRVRSRTELRMRRLCREAGLPEPIVNGHIDVGGWSFEVDLHWPSLRLVVEVDGYRFHGGRRRANDDRERDQLLTIAGWTVVRFTRDQVVDEPELVVRRLRALAAGAR